MEELLDLINLVELVEFVEVCGIAESVGIGGITQDIPLYRITYLGASLKIVV